MIWTQCFNSWVHVLHLRDNRRHCLFRRKSVSSNMRQVPVQGSDKISIAALTNDHRFSILKECLLIIPKFCRSAAWLHGVSCWDFTNWNQRNRKASFPGFHSAGSGDPSTFKFIQIAGPFWFLMVVRLRSYSLGAARFFFMLSLVPPPVSAGWVPLLPQFSPTSSVTCFLLQPFLGF